VCAPIGGTAVQSSDRPTRHRIVRERKLSVFRPSVSGMKTTRTTPPLRLLAVDHADAAQTAGATEAADLIQPVGSPGSDPVRERYWAQVQALRGDLARLRPAN
jgi:hypothetical protein